MSPHLQRWRYFSNLLYGLRMLLGFGGVALVPYLLGQHLLIIPLTLGLSAAALSDIDDRFSLRLRNMLMSYVGFFVTAVMVYLLIPYPVLFGVMLIAGYFGLILLGSLGRRYAQLSFGCLIVSIYAMLGVQFFHHWYEQGALFVIGAMWYGLLSTLFFLLFPVQLVRERLVACYQRLGDLLYAKSALFDVDMDPQDYQAAMLELTLTSGKVTALFNQTREALVTRLKGDRGQQDTRRALQYYFVAQDIQERADSAHLDYLALAEALRHRDVMFRLQRLLSLQARACQQLAKMIQQGRPYEHNTVFARHFRLLQRSIALLQQEDMLDPVLLSALDGIYRNLREIDRQLGSFADERRLGTPSVLGDDDDLHDDRLQGWADIRQRIQQNFTPQSGLFRHAVRLSVLAVTGHSLVQIFDLEFGYWIVLTILFVCQPNFDATRRRLKLRIYGTLGGVLLGSFILQAVPSTAALLVISVCCGVLFFEFRAKQYAQATVFFTILALINFHLAEPEAQAALPRMLFTLIGCAIAWAGSVWIFPDWKYRRLDQVVERSFRAQCLYLNEITSHYQSGRNNSLTYRRKRRQAHNLDSELASVVAVLGTEPGIDPLRQQQAYRLLTLNHTLLSYLGALSAHRQQLDDPELLAILQQAGIEVHQVLLDDYAPSELQRQIRLLLDQADLPDDPQQHLRLTVLQQINLMLNVLPQLAMLKQQLLFMVQDELASLPVT